MAGRKLDGRISAVRVDVAGYRKRREEQLRNQAMGLAERVERSGRRAMTEPLPPAERRLVHRVLAESPTVRTHTGGSGVNQRVIITPSRRRGRKS
jgi:spoIIIJ-associated protein